MYDCRAPTPMLPRLGLSMGSCELALLAPGLTQFSSLRSKPRCCVVICDVTFYSEGSAGGRPGSGCNLGGDIRVEFRVVRPRRTDVPADLRSGSRSRCSRSSEADVDETPRRRCPPVGSPWLISVAHREVAPPRYRCPPSLGGILSEPVGRGSLPARQADRDRCMAPHHRRCVGARSREPFRSGSGISGHVVLTATPWRCHGAE